MSVEVRAADPAFARDILGRNHSLRVARSGELVYPLEHEMLMAVHEGRPIALATFVVDGAECEITTLHSDVEGAGAGSALIEAVADTARARGFQRLWLITTNDNTHAIRFYQRRGFVIAGINVGAMDTARATIKPEIPEHGNDDIPIRDEVVFEKTL